MRLKYMTKEEHYHSKKIGEMVVFGKIPDDLRAGMEDITEMKAYRIIDKYWINSASHGFVIEDDGGKPQRLHRVFFLAE